MMVLNSDSNNNSKISQLVNTLIPRGELDKDNEYIDVSKCYVALYKPKRKVRNKPAVEYNFDVFKEFYNSEVGIYYKSIDNKLVGVGIQNNSIKTTKTKERINCLIVSANNFDIIRLLMYNNGLIKAYVPGKATKEEIREVIVKLGCFDQFVINFFLNDVSVETRKRRRG